MALTEEQRKNLEQEWSELQEQLKQEFCSPKVLRRIDEITSLLMTDGESADVKFNFLKGKDSKRVTSFTRNRK
jgi:hypothetical protein